MGGSAFNQNLSLWKKMYAKVDGPSFLSKHLIFFCVGIFARLFPGFQNAVVKDRKESGKSLLHFKSKNSLDLEELSSLLCITPVFRAFISTHPLWIHQLPMPVNSSNSPVSFIQIVLTDPQRESSDPLIVSRSC